MANIQNPFIISIIIGIITFTLLYSINIDKKERKKNKDCESFYRSKNCKYIVTFIVMLITYLYLNTKNINDLSNNRINVIENLSGDISNNSIDIIAPGISLPKYNGLKLPSVLINTI